MSALFPLLLLWFASRPKGAATLTRETAPRWPTPASPPPMPAFQPAMPAAPSADPSQSSTPLADLHNAPPKLEPAHAAQNKAASMSAFKSRATTLLQERLRANAPTSSVPVAKLQQILAMRGVKVSRDGLYGPRTASAWGKLAASKGLAPTISRVGPKIAKVVTRTYESLSVPAIP